MSQEINLYHPIFRRHPRRFSARAMSYTALLALVLVAGLGGWQGYQLMALERVYEELGREEAVLQQRLQAINAELAARKRGRNLASEVERLERLVAARVQVREALSEPVFANTRGYSPQFQALARQHLPGLWITGLRITSTGKSMSLEGRAFKPALVPRYIGRLAREQSLRGLQFDQFTMTRPEDERGGARADYVVFRISSADNAGRRP